MTLKHIENQDDYAEYRSAVQAGLGDLHASSGPCPGCKDCGLEDVDGMEDERYEAAGEAEFSHSPCHICNRPLGGDRYPVHAVTEDGDIFHYDACTDCVHFIEYGTLDDMTMLDIES